MGEDMKALLLSALGGSCVGFLFFGGLLWTIRRGLSSRRPALFFLAGYMLRMTGALFSFYWISSGLWERLIACLIGFVSVRFLFTFSVKNSEMREEKNGSQP